MIGPTLPPSKERCASASWIITLVLACAFGGSASAATRITSIGTGIAGSGDEAGYSIAMSGNTVAVGAVRAAPVPEVSSGAVEIFRNDGSEWDLEAILKASDSAAGLRFGETVALDGNVATVAAPGSAGGPVAIYTFVRTGTAWSQVDKFIHPTDSGRYFSLSGDALAIADGTVYLRSGSGWSQQIQLQPDLGSDEVLGFGVAVDGNRLAIGSTRSQFHMPSHYYAYMFARSGNTWVREDKVDLGLHSNLMSSFLTLAISGDTVLAGTDSGVGVFARSGSTWTSEGMLDPLGMTSGFGKALALDGSRAVVASPDDMVLGQLGAGSIYVFARTGGAWTRTMRLYDPDTADFSFALGTSIAMEGDNVASGSPQGMTDAGASGKASIFDISGGTWLVSAELTAGYSHAGERFGDAVSRSGNTLLVGAPNATTDSVWVRGAAYVIELVGGAWQEVSRLVPTSSRTQGFGQAVSLDGETAVVGASRDDQIGAIYVFVLQAGEWLQQARLTGGTANTSYFGWSVVLQDDLVVAGAPEGSAAGAAYVFERAGAVWSAQNVIQPADSANGDGFGYSVALSGDTLVVGAPRADIGIETDAGAAYVFRRSGALWIQEAKLQEPNAINGRAFGGSVAIAGNTVVVGAASPSSSPISPIRGGAYVFERSGSQWNLEASLKPMVNETSETFGYSLSISDSEDLILVGTPDRATAPSYAGAIYTFRNDGSGWLASSVYYGTAPAAPYPRSDNFGYSSSISGEEAVIGAPGDGYKGAAYVESVGQLIFASGFD